MAILDNKDLKILRALQRDARVPYKKIAEQLKVSEGTIFNRVDRLRKAGVLRGFHADIDYEKLGYEITAVIGVNAHGPKLIKTEEKISKFKEIVGVYDVTGTYDAILVAKVKSRVDLDNFVKNLGQIPEIDQTHTFIVLNTKKEDFSDIEL